MDSYDAIGFTWSDRYEPVIIMLLQIHQKFLILAFRKKKLELYGSINSSQYQPSKIDPVNNILEN